MTNKMIIGVTWETDGWHEAARAAASWREGPDPANSMEMELSLLKELAAATALTDGAFIEPPSCSARTNVLTYIEKDNNNNKIEATEIKIVNLERGIKEANIISYFDSTFWPLSPNLPPLLHPHNEFSNIL